MVAAIQLVHFFHVSGVFDEYTAHRHLVKASPYLLHNKQLNQFHIVALMNEPRQLIANTRISRRSVVVDSSVRNDKPYYFSVKTEGKKMNFGNQWLCVH